MFAKKRVQCSLCGTNLCAECGSGGKNIPTLMPHLGLVAGRAPPQPWIACSACSALLDRRSSDVAKLEDALAAIDIPSALTLLGDTFYQDVQFGLVR